MIAAWAAGWRLELARLRASPWDLGLMTLAPLLALVLLGALFHAGSADNLAIAVIDADHSATSRELTRLLRASPLVRVAAEPAGLPEAWTLVRRGEVWAVLHVPAGLERQVLRGETADVLVYRNAAFYSISAVAGRGITGALAQLNAGLLARLALQHGLPALRVEAPRVQATVLFNPQLSQEWFLEALLQPGTLHVLMSALVVVALGRGVAPGGLAAMAGQLAPYVLVFTAWQWAGTAWLCGWRGWGVHGSLPLLLLGQFVLYACYAAMAALVALGLRDTYTALSAVALYGGPAITFSDATLPVAGGPLFTQLWSQALPFSAYIKLQMEQVFMGSPAVDSLPWLGHMAAVGLVAFLLAGWLVARGRGQPVPESVAPAAAARPPSGAAFSAELAHGLRDTMRQVLHTRPALVILVLAGLVYGFYYPAAYRHESALQLPLAVVDLDGGVLSGRLIERLSAAPQLKIRQRDSDLSSARQRLLNREVDAIVVVPAGFERGLLAGTRADALAVYMNGAYLVRASAVADGLQTVLSGALAELAAGPARALGLHTLQPVAALQHPLFNTREGYGSYVVPGVAVIIVHQTLLMGIGLILAERRRLGAAYASGAELLGGALAFVGLGTLTALFYSGFVFWFQDYPRGGRLAVVLCATLLFVAATVAFALLLGSLFDRGERPAQALAASSALLFFLSGMPWPFSAMPQPLAWLAQWLPSTAGVQALVKANQMQAGLADVAPELATLALLTLGYGALAAYRLLHRRPRDIAGRCNGVPV